MTSRDWAFFLLGVGILLFVKYIVFGLKEWNAWLHPDRKDNPQSVFYRPFLGLTDLTK
ncbi:MAG: hypothetical protein KGJ60_13845 [Verrucomicrobiota bacterium]|nr:hypothetical protein [Verrucomicrobiota bacterium]